MKVGVVGTGYVGLVTGTCLAEKGNEVTCVDNNLKKVDMLRAGEVPIYEPGLEEMVRLNQERGTLRFTTDLEEGVADTDTTFLALPTPEGQDGSADLRYVLGVASQIGHLLTRYNVIVTKSTVPPGTTKQVRQTIAEKASVEFGVASNPEFLKEGDAVHDFQHPDRIVVGVDSDQSWKVMKELYLPFVPNAEHKLKRVDIASAELIKYGSNVFLAAKVALVNELANISELVGADVREVAEAIGMDPRIGEKFLNPGPGYGGSCFPKDVQALERTAAQFGYEFKIAQAVHAANEKQKNRLYEKVLEYFGGQLHDKNIALWGLSFKPNTDDIRESPAISLIDGLSSRGASIVGYDPKAVENMRRHYAENQNLTFADNQYDALKDADALVIITDWDEFKTPDWTRMKAFMKAPVIFDGRYLYSRSVADREGFFYDSIGMKKAQSA